MLRRFGLLAVGALLAGCSGAAVSSTAAQATVSGPNADTDTFGNSRVRVTAGAAGVSQTFMVTSGTYAIQYLIDGGNDHGCAFVLIVTTKKGSAAIESTSAVLPTSAEGSGGVTWKLSAGTYLLQEDESGSANCHRGFQATVTAQN